MSRRERSRSPRDRRAAMRVKKPLSQVPATGHNRPRRIFLSVFLSSCLRFATSPRNFHESSPTITRLRPECTRNAPRNPTKFRNSIITGPLEPSREKLYGRRRWTVRIRSGIRDSEIDEDPEHRPAKVQIYRSSRRPRTRNSFDEEKSIHRTLFP